MTETLNKLRDVSTGESASRSDPDVRLMLQVRAGDERAFAALVHRHWDSTQRRLADMLGCGTELEDLTQDVFLRVYRYRGNYQPRAPFTAWLQQITLNVGRNALRSRRRFHQRIGPMEDEQSLDSVPDPRTEGPLNRLLRQDRQREVRAALSRLPDRTRAVIRMQQFENRSYREIAARLNTSRDSVRSLLQRGRERLRELLTVPDEL